MTMRIVSGILAVVVVVVGVLYGVGVGKLDKATAMWTSLEGQLTTEKAHAADLQTQLTAANANVTSLTTELAAVSAKTSSLTADLATATTNLATANSRVSTLTADLATANSRVSTLTADLATANSRVSTLTADLATANARVTSLTNNLTIASSQIASLTANLTAANAKYDVFKQDVTSKWNSLEPTLLIDYYITNYWIYISWKDADKALETLSVISPYVVQVNDSLLSGYYQQAMTQLYAGQTDPFMQTFASFMLRNQALLRDRYMALGTKLAQ